MRTVQGFLLWAIVCSAAHANSDQLCGPLANGYGPYDYRVDGGPKLKIVEDFHFTARVEMLVGGLSSTIGGDINYTLRAFPNHHRALVAMMNLGVKLKSEQPPGAQHSVECYFRRALAFKADDYIARLIFVTYLANNNRKAEAMQHLEYVVASAADEGAAQYNAGLLYVDLGEYGRALTQAYRAQALGFPGTAIRERLEVAGKWVEPQNGAPAVPASQPAR